MASILFLDRDGVLNRDDGYTYVFDPSIIYSDVTTLKNSNFDYNVIVTNQAGIGRGYYTVGDFHKFMREMSRFLKNELDLIIHDYFFCPHAPAENCCCRKPKPFLVEKALRKYDADPSSCVMVGDKLTDLDAAKSAGVFNTFLLQRENFDPIAVEEIHSIGSLYDLPFV